MESSLILCEGGTISGGFGGLGGFIMMGESGEFIIQFNWIKI